MKTVKKQIGRNEIILETGRMAKQADGAVIVQCGGTVVLVTAVAAKQPKEGQDFFPLTVDYRERTYAAGKIPGGYFKREGKPTEKEILTSRLIDRPIRPLFPEHYFNEVQVMATVLSVDGETNADVLAVNGASAALAISSIPFEGPIGAVRVGMFNGEFILNPNYTETAEGALDLVLVGTKGKITMIESGAKEISEEEMLKAIEFGSKEIEKVLQLQEELIKAAGKPKAALPPAPEPSENYKKAVELSKKNFHKLLNPPSKEGRSEIKEQVYKEILASFDQDAEDFNEKDIKKAFEEVEFDEVRRMILKEKKRPDNRSFKELRNISCEVAVLPRTHGSALFTRGQTQSLAVTTLGTSADEQMIDALEGETYKRFMLHYNFPPFSVGETGRNSGPGRREIGHGALAERSLIGVMPSEEDFPYTVRLVSDILESNGSSSMASVCGGTLSLMDAGVPIKAPVAGIALGLITEEGNVSEGKYEILTDIAGIEDHLGDMDFKVAGTKEGITALQLDIKIKGITTDIIRKALAQGHEARMAILDIMTKSIDKPRKDLSKYAPRITVLTVNPNKIKDLIGPGGKVIKKIIEETGVKIDIEDDGRVYVASSDAKASETAISKINAITEDAVVGKIYTAKVRKIMNFGAFCEIIPGTDGLVHISEIADGYVKTVDDHLKVGDIVTVKVMSIDDQGKINLSMKRAKDEGQPDGEKNREKQEA